jgi:hypothetical protein
MIAIVLLEAEWREACAPELSELLLPLLQDKRVKSEVKAIIIDLIRTPLVWKGPGFLD